MSADAMLIANLSLENNIYKKLEEAEEYVDIQINYGATATNLSAYASKDDVSVIDAELTINGVKVSKITDTETLSINKPYTYRFYKKDESGDSVNYLHIKCNAMLKTKFQGDSPLYAESESSIFIGLLKEEELDEKTKDIIDVNNVNRRNTSGDMPKIVSIEIKRLSTDAKGNRVYVDLSTAKKTNSQFICAGQVLYIRVKAQDSSRVTLEFAGDRSIITFDELTKQFEWTESKERNEKPLFNSLSSLQKLYKMPLSLTLEKEEGETQYFSTLYVVPYKTSQTLNSWSTLREKNRNAFQINENELFTRIDNPYEIVIKARSSVGTKTKRVKLDVFEAWNTIYNRDLTPYIK